MLEKSRNAVFFQWFVCQVSRKVGLLKRRVRSHVVSGESKKLHAAVAKSTFWSENVQNTSVSDHFMKFRCGKIVRALWQKAHSEVKMWNNWQSGTTFWSSDVQKLYAAVAKSTFGSENVKKLTIRDHFLKCRCGKIVRRCGEKHIRKWKC